MVLVLANLNETADLV